MSLLAIALLLLAVLDPKPLPKPPSRGGGAGGEGGGPTRIAALHKVMPPKEAHSSECADQGRGTKSKSGTYPRVDTLTDLLKNRIDDGSYQPATIADVLSLPWQGLPLKRWKWTAANTASVAKYEAAPIELTGWLVGIKQESKEQTNCEISDPSWYDWHAWLVATEDEAHNNDKTHAIVIEITPRVRAANSGAFDTSQILTWSRNGTEVKVDGWLLLDPDHPNDVGSSRGTIWEVHPVLKIGPAS